MVIGKGGRFNLPNPNGIGYRVGDELGFNRSPTPAGQGLCGFNRAWSLVVKLRV